MRTNREASQVTVIAVLNQKGGVGKTTTALNLAHAWAARGLRVLVVDVDKQAAATAALAPSAVDRADVRTVADVLRTESSIATAILPAESPVWAGIDVVPASLDLEDVWASTRPGLVFRLRRALDLADVATRYDRVVLDGPPDLGPATVAAVVAADAVVVPTRPERQSMHGVARTAETVAVVARDMRPDVELVAVIPFAVDDRVGEHAARVDELRAIYGPTVTETVVGHRLKSDEASGAGVPAARLEGPAGVALGQTFADLAHELDSRIGDTHE